MAGPLIRYDVVPGKTIQVYGDPEGFRVELYESSGMASPGPSIGAAPGRTGGTYEVVEFRGYVTGGELPSPEELDSMEVEEPSRLERFFHPLLPGCLSILDGEAVERRAWITNGDDPGPVRELEAVAEEHTEPVREPVDAGIEALLDSAVE